MFALVDCNNFYCSCERVFNPALRDKPVVVLSNNDGRIIARSNEAKALGIKMGEPFFKIRQTLEEQKVAVFSSNYALYGDMSHRVMSLLSEFTPDITIYSIDEAFLQLPTAEHDPTFSIEEYGKKIVRTVTKGTGIPVTIGIAPTKTLAKIASHFGKQYAGYKNVCLIDTEEKRAKALQLTPIHEVWGIGLSPQLAYYGIRTAWDLTQKSEQWVRRNFSVTLARTWKELQGDSCIDIEELPHSKSICTSRSFPEKGISELPLGRSRSQFRSILLPQAQTAAHGLLRHDDIRLHKPLPDKRTPLPTITDMQFFRSYFRPTGNCQPCRRSSPTTLAGRHYTFYKESRCHRLGNHTRYGYTGPTIRPD